MFTYQHVYIYEEGFHVKRQPRATTKKAKNKVEILCLLAPVVWASKGH